MTEVLGGRAAPVKLSSVRPRLSPRPVGTMRDNEPGAMDFVEELKSRVDIVGVIGEKVRLRKTGAYRYSGLCPFHQEKTPSFSVHATKQFYYCFGCQAKGDVVRFVMELEGLSFYEALKSLAERNGIPMPKRSQYADEDSRQREALYQMHELAQENFRAGLAGPAGEIARAYLARRGVRPETIEQFGLGYSDRNGRSLLRQLEQRGFSPAQLEPSGLVRRRDDGSFYDYFRNRLMFPIHSESGKIIGFGGRALADDDNPKYLNSPETPIYKKSHVLYNLHRAKEAIRKEERGVFGVERQRNEGDEAVCFVLQRAQLHQVVGAGLIVFDVAVEHGAVRPKAKLVGGARGLEPFVAVDLVIANDEANAIVENLGPAPRHRIHAGVAQPLQRLADRNAAAPRQVRDLHHREGLQMHLGKALLEAAQHLAKPVQRQLRMQAAHDMEFGDRFAPAFARALPYLVERHGVCLGIAHALAESAQPATRHTNVGGVNVPVDVEVSGIAVHPLANQVGQIPQRQDIAGAVERYAIVEGEPLAGFHFSTDGNQASVIDNCHVLHVWLEQENIGGPE